MTTQYRFGGFYASAYAHEVLSVGATAVPLTDSPTNLAPASGSAPTQITISVEGGDARMRYDGTAPTSTTGHLLEAGRTYVIEGLSNLYKTQFILDSGAPVGTASVRVTWER